jgi:hypothetical protein
VSRIALFLFLSILSSPAFAGRHVDATNCEIFVDKLELSYGSHGSSAIQPFVKLLPSRLDGMVKEVGFHFTSVSRGYNGGHDSLEPWRDQPLSSVSPVNDYFTAPWEYMVGSDFGAASYEGAFYVITTAGTTYWAKTASGGNFRFDSAFFNRIWSQDSYGYRRAVPTQSALLRELNPQSCY